MIQSIYGQLQDAVKNIDKDELSGLAKMHGWCEEIASASSEGGTTPCPSLNKHAAEVIGILEKLILGEVEDATAAVAAVSDGIAGLQALIPTITSANPVSDQADTQDAVESADEQATAAAASDPTMTPSSPSSTDASAQSPAPVSSAPVPPPPPDQAVERYQSAPLTIDPKELEFVSAFVEEASEHIESIEGAVLAVEQTPDDAEKINDLFRPFHTIKGMAGFLNLRDINCLTHEVETLLDQARRGERQVSRGMIDLILEAVDLVKAQIAEIRAYAVAPTGAAVPQPAVADMIERLRAEIGNIAADEAPSSVYSPVTATPVPTVSAEPVASVRKSETAASGAAPGAGSSPPAMPGQPGAAPTPPASEAATARAAAAVDQSIRIETGKLDSLIEMVGELVIAQTLVGTHEKIAGDPLLSRDVSQVDKIVRELQEVAMSMRMITLRSTFQRMARLVRDLSRKAGKEVELVISGEDTELDKNVIQQIGDPLVHMVRNAVDHGIEAPDVRRSAGKNATGRMQLSAFHHGGNVVIEISDDGKGLDAPALITKAIEKELIKPDAELTDEEAFHLIFAPGFSTAAKITDISGRGVGMDVVKRNIEELRGKVDISSRLGKGSTFSIRLPLTLAIIDGMVVRIGPERFIIPTISIEQALQPRSEQITTVHQRGEMLQVRGRLVPLVQLGSMFGLGPNMDPCASMVVIAHSGDRPIGLIVDELLGQQQVVIKSLGERLRHLRGISGAAILGDGRVGLILDVAGVDGLFEQWHPAASRRRTEEIARPAPRRPEVSSTDATARGAEEAPAEPELLEAR